MELVVADYTQVKPGSNAGFYVVDRVVAGCQGGVDDFKVGHVNAHGDTEVDGFFAHFVIVELSVRLPG